MHAINAINLVPPSMRFMPSIESTIMTYFMRTVVRMKYGKRSIRPQCTVSQTARNDARVLQCEQLFA
eukprot:11220169-Lingulodinium_polyedra.AAC.1